MEQKINPLQSNQGRQNSGNNRSSVRQRATGTGGQQTAQTTRTVGSSANYGVARNAASLHIGDVLRGEITDLRNNQISITLQDNTVVRAQIPDSASYSIGQTGSFRLTNISGGTIYLENISIGYTESELTLINKALESAGLPATEHNQATVKALMDNMLPINRESIQQLMQQSYDFSTEDMNTLALMKRLMLKMDTDSVTQFSNYRNDNYQLLGRLQSFAQDIPSLLGALAQNGPADAVASFGRSLLSIGLSEMPTTQGATLADLPPQVQDDILKMLSGTPLTSDIVDELTEGTLSLQDALTLLRDSALAGTLVLPEDASPAALADFINLLNQTLEPAATDTPLITEELLKNMVQSEEEAETAGQQQDIEIDAAENTEAKAEGRFAFAGKFLQSLSENAKNFTDTLSNIRSSIAATAGETASQTLENETITTLTQAYEKFAHDNDLLSSYLPSGERNELIQQLQGFPISRELLMKIVSGEATTKEVLSIIKSTISLTDSEKVQELFRSDVFEKIFARELQSGWTMTPEQLAEKNPSEFYSKIHQQMEQFHSLIKNTLSGSDSQSLGSMAHDIESNISFMKTLNETFSYFQLPLRLPSQDAHGDLYVYSRKEKLRQNSEKASVLLHLNLEHLGQIDIKLDKDHHDIAASFSLNDKESVQLFRVNADMLRDGLNRQGFNCLMQVQEKEQPSPTVDDFINTKINTHATTEMKRFSFDIRA